MLDIVHAIQEEQRQRYVGARKSLFALLRKVLTWKRPDVEKAVSLTAESKIDPKWLSYCAKVSEYEAAQAKLAATLPERAAEQQMAEADLQAAKQRHDEAVAKAEAELLAATQRVHAARIQWGQATEAQTEVARIRADFAPLFDVDATEFADLRDVEQLPRALQGFARQIGLADRNGRLPPIADQEAVAEREAELRRLFEQRQQAAIASQYAQRRAAQAANPTMAKE